MKPSLVKLTTFVTLLTFNTLASECASLDQNIDPAFALTESIKTVEIVTNALRIKKGDRLVNTDLTELKKVDRRQQKNKNSPKVLDAVGRISIIYSDGTRANCSGTLIAVTPGNSSRTISSAAHCFGDTKTKSKYEIDYITWTTTTQSGRKINANLEIESINLDADNAILSMRYKIPFSQIEPALYENEMTLSPSDMIFYNEEATIIAAGYSSDDYLGQRGEVLTYDDKINYNHFRRTLSDELNRNTGLSIRSVSFSGASGGALLINTDLSEEDIENPYNQTYYIGTIIAVDSSESEIYGYKNNNSVGSNITVSRSYTTLDSNLISRLNRQ